MPPICFPSIVDRTDFCPPSEFTYSNTPPNCVRVVPVYADEAQVVGEIPPRVHFYIAEDGDVYQLAPIESTPPRYHAVLDSTGCILIGVEFGTVSRGQILQIQLDLLPGVLRYVLTELGLTPANVTNALPPNRCNPDQWDQVIDDLQDCLGQQPPDEPPLPGQLDCADVRDCFQAGQSIFIGTSAPYRLSAGELRNPSGYQFAWHAPDGVQQYSFYALPPAPPYAVAHGDPSGSGETTFSSLFYYPYAGTGLSGSLTSLANSTVAIAGNLNFSTGVFAHITDDMTIRDSISSDIWTHRVDGGVIEIFGSSLHMYETRGVNARLSIADVRIFSSEIGDRLLATHSDLFALQANVRGDFLINDSVVCSSLLESDGSVSVVGGFISIGVSRLVDGSTFVYSNVNARGARLLAVDSLCSSLDVSSADAAQTQVGAFFSDLKMESVTSNAERLTLYHSKVSLGGPLSFVSGGAQISWYGSLEHVRFNLGALTVGAIEHDHSVYLGVVNAPAYPVTMSATLAVLGPRSQPRQRGNAFSVGNGLVFADYNTNVPPAAHDVQRTLEAGLWIGHNVLTRGGVQPVRRGFLHIGYQTTEDPNALVQVARGASPTDTQISAGGYSVGFYDSVPVCTLWRYLVGGVPGVAMFFMPHGNYNAATGNVNAINYANNAAAIAALSALNADPRLRIGTIVPMVVAGNVALFAWNGTTWTRITV